MCPSDGGIFRSLTTHGDEQNYQTGQESEMKNEGMRIRIKTTTYVIVHVLFTHLTMTKRNSQLEQESSLESVITLMLTFVQLN